MINIEKLIINTEFFLQCNGSCSGCFLTEEERLSDNTYYDAIFNGLKEVSENYKNKHISFLVIGFGRGNTLMLNRKGIDSLLNLIKWCRENFSFDDVIFEVSTSLIGKIETQIDVAQYIVNLEKNAYFNIVLNSELTSKSFWKNVSLFHNEMSKFRTEKYNIIDGNSDILVLNVNPNNLPSLNDIEDFTKDYQSPVNISIFPFDNGVIIDEEKLRRVKEWSKDLWLKFKEKDLNIKNFLYGLNNINIDENINEYINYTDKTLKSYIFIDKNGLITNGSLSIMGEVDKLRLMEKFGLNLSINEGYKVMMKNKYCRLCKNQKQCLLSGAYLNLMANSKNINTSKNKGCLSGYEELFTLSMNK